MSAEENPKEKPSDRPIASPPRPSPPPKASKEVASQPPMGSSSQSPPTISKAHHGLKINIKKSSRDPSNEIPTDFAPTDAQSNVREKVRLESLLRFPTAPFPEHVASPSSAPSPQPQTTKDKRSTPRAGEPIDEEVECSLHQEIRLCPQPLYVQWVDEEGNYVGVDDVVEERDRKFFKESLDRCLMPQLH